MRNLIILACWMVGTFAGHDKPFFEKSRFPADLYREMLKLNYGNLFVSPLSLQAAFALMQSGAEGMVSAEISLAFGLPDSFDETEKIFSNLTSLLHDSEHYNLSSINGIFVDCDLEVRTEFEDVALKAFGTEIKNVDFAEKDKAADEINSWVRRKAHNKIGHFLKPDYISADARLVLINTMFLQGKWAVAPEHIISTKRVFFLSAKDYFNADMIEMKGLFNYYKSSELRAQFLQIYYQGSDISITIVLPDKIEGLSALEEKITKHWILPKLSVSKVIQLILPKFKTTSTVDFVPVLKGLGVWGAFEANAGFSKIEVDNERLYINNVMQKTYITIDEKGISADATTSDRVHLSSKFSYQDIPQVFKVDHPFMYYISSDSTGAILFVGRVTSP